MTARFRARVYRRPMLEGGPWRFEVREVGNESPAIAGSRDTHDRALFAACGYLMGMSPDYSPVVWVDNMLRMLRP